MLTLVEYAMGEMLEGGIYQTLDGGGYPVVDAFPWHPGHGIHLLRVICDLTLFSPPFVPLSLFTIGQGLRKRVFDRSREFC